MVRTQIQLSPEQFQALRRLSAVTGRSLADLVREGVDHVLSAAHGAGPDDRLERARGVVGRFSSGVSDVSADHDRHLAEAFER